MTKSQTQLLVTKFKNRLTEIAIMIHDNLPPAITKFNKCNVAWTQFGQIPNKL